MIQTMLFCQQSIWYLLILELSRYLYAVNYDVTTLWCHNMMSSTSHALFGTNPKNGREESLLVTRNKPLLHTPLPMSVMSQWQLELLTQIFNIREFPLIFRLTEDAYISRSNAITDSTKRTSHSKWNKRTFQRIVLFINLDVLPLLWTYSSK